MLRRLLWFVVVLLAIVGAAALAAGLLLMRGGIGSRAEPGWLETRVARTLRSVAIPRDARDLTNPVPASADVFEAGLRHFADHCAVCHANNGSGETEIGRGLYPKAPDMRQAATQNLTDGELFYIIENGVKLTGMPAWGTGEAEGKTESWHLVHFIRQLPKVSEADVERMKALNPKSADEWRQAEEERRFLEGTDKAPAPAPSHTHKEGGHR